MTEKKMQMRKAFTNVETTDSDWAAGLTYD